MRERERGGEVGRERGGGGVGERDIGGNGDSGNGGVLDVHGREGAVDVFEWYEESDASYVDMRPVPSMSSPSR